MKTLHLCMDHNFINDSRKKFEEYYPGENIYIVHNDLESLKILKDTTGFKVYNLLKSENQQIIVDICKNEKVDKVVLHGMLHYMLDLLPKIKAVRDVKIYWLFWGYELYETLAFKKNYHVLDDHFNPFNMSSYYKPFFVTKMIRRMMGKCKADYYERIMPMVDYFCFWNKRDYDLLKSYYDLPLKFRFFAYNATDKDSEPPYIYPLKDREATKILINHQASAYGNHTTIFRRLAEIDKNNKFEKIVPVSYGFMHIKNDILRKGRKYLGNSFHPIENYMPKADYYKMLQSVDIAIFGQHRQEASGNIIQLLRNGVKVFLRNDNNLLAYYREKGYIIFSFEDDLKDMSSLTSLTIEQKEHNRRNALAKRLYYNDFMPHVLDD